MKSRNYHNSITAGVTAAEAFNKLSEVAKWWTANFTGSAKELNDVFTIRFGDNTFTFRVTESVPGKKLAWLTTDCYMSWIHNKTEWTNTKIVFEISEEKGKTRIDMTHAGLVPEMECYQDCDSGWNQYFCESLPAFLTMGTGILVDD
jgi:hypothetical protein